MSLPATKGRWKSRVRVAMFAMLCCGGCELLPSRGSWFARGALIVTCLVPCQILLHVKGHDLCFCCLMPCYCTANSSLHCPNAGLSCRMTQVACLQAMLHQPCPCSSELTASGWREQDASMSSRRAALHYPTEKRNPSFIREYDGAKQGRIQSSPFAGSINGGGSQIPPQLGVRERGVPEPPRHCCCQRPPPGERSRQARRQARPRLLQGRQP